MFANWKRWVRLQPLPIRYSFCSSVQLLRPGWDEMRKIERKILSPNSSVYQRHPFCMLRMQAIKQLLRLWYWGKSCLQDRQKKLANRAKINRESEQALPAGGVEGNTEWEKAVNLVDFGFSRPNGSDLSRFKNVLFTAKSKNVPLQSKFGVWVNSEFQFCGGSSHEWWCHVSLHKMLIPTSATRLIANLDGSLCSGTFTSGFWKSIELPSI